MKAINLYAFENLTYLQTISNNSDNILHYDLSFFKKDHLVF